MSGKAKRRKLKQQQAARSRTLNRSTPWIVAGAFVASTAMGRADLLAQTFQSTAFMNAGVPGAAGEQAARRLSIPPGPLGEVLEAFERLTGVHVDVTAEGMRAIYSPGVSGVLTDREALQQLLQGTGLSGRFVSSQRATLEFRTASESVDVTANAPVLASPKYTAPLRDIPQTINVLKSDLLAQQGATTLRDALRNVTGITFQAGEGGTPAGDQMTIRGFSARTDMFVDGVRDSGGYSRDTFNLEQVEVAKGPSSAIAGRGSTGGSINLVSKRPQLAPTSGATLEGGSADSRRGTVDVNHAISGLEGAAFRVNAMWNDSGSSGRDIARDKRWALAPSVEFGIRTPTRVALSYFHMSQDNIPDYGVPWVPAANEPLAAYAGGRGPAASSNYYGLVNRDHEDIGNDIATAQIEHNFTSGINLRNVTRIGNTRRDSVTTAPRFVSNDSTDIRRTDMKSRDQNDDIVANQTNLTAHYGVGSLRHDLVAGLELSRETSKNFARADVGSDTPVSPDTDFFHPNPYGRYTGAVVRTGAYTNAEAQSAGVYAFDTMSLGTKWQLTGGLRWDRFDVDYESVAADGLSMPLGRTDRMVSGRAGVVFKPREQGSLYAGYATSFNPSAEGLSLRDTTVDVEPEKTRSLEAGTKWDFMDDRLSVNGAVFRIDKTNARTPGINPGDPPTVLQGEQVVDGMEVGLSGTITDRWTGFASYSFMHSDIPQSNTPAEVEQALALTPRHTFNLWTTYQVWRSVRAGGGAQFMDGVFRNSSNTVNVPSYWLVNALAEYGVNEHLTLRLNGNNLGDTDYVDRVGGGHYIPGPRRTLMLSTAVSF
jgi:catecholate siderophore receptor